MQGRPARSLVESAESATMDLREWFGWQDVGNFYQGFRPEVKKARFFGWSFIQALVHPVDEIGDGSFGKPNRVPLASPTGSREAERWIKSL